MPRNMSVALTIDAVKARQKTVTRRAGWTFLKPGDLLTLCEKCQGRKPGEPLVRLATVQVVNVRREPLFMVTADEVDKEGFLGMTPEQFLRTYFVEAQGMSVRDEVTRVEWIYVEDGEDRG
jgi:hypothetical protein